ncbi:chemotaxis protein CheW [Chitinimonas sp. BJB300]|uniref:chemotaxis protein CheW n=1 Tax=Chitinimonas sp. BJB300 TaxID=1559339 RepID=UPI000C0EB43F|nr:chemotaxis protein CheW [Chitinimonas sp. BJB300]PHV10982.1 chemotaxis protein CheA [Chitinimonas sp. BJB300]TSJ87539.1 chemotaxis protein CheA [Chitinimonas sp. BJB300]
MNIDMSQFIQTFFEETGEHLSSMENLLLSLNIEAPDAEELNAIFRAAHSIKGGAATFGFTDLTEVTHILENQLDRVRRGTLQLRIDMVDTFLQAGDALRGMLEVHQNGKEEDKSVAETICAKLQALEQTDQPAKAAPSYWGLCLRGQKRDDDSLRQALLSQGWVQDDDGPDRSQFYVATMDTEAQLRDALDFVLARDEYTLTLAENEVAATNPVMEEGDGYGLFAPAAAATHSAVLEEGDGFGLFAPVPASGVVEEGDGYGLFAAVSRPAPVPSSGVIEEGNRYGLFAPVSATTEAVVAEEPAQVARVGGRRASDREKEATQAAESASIRVGVEKVDQIINLVGELVITQAMLAQVASNFDPAVHERLHNGVALLERNTRELQESAMSIRMMPISFVFSRFPRVVRDTAAKLDKKVRLVTQGEGTELDRGLIEKLADPMTHLVRNSLDHGIERPEVRVAKGKDEIGTLTLKAFHQGGNIIIQVLDDGAGLNRDRILAKAKSQGMSVSDAMTDAEVWPLIFEPGFSTAETVTDVSGRGVGMDVVRRNIQSMGGRIDIDTIKDGGTNMTIRLPLTLAILDGMAIRVEKNVYVIPLTFIVESLQPDPEHIKTVAGKGRVVHMRGEYLPVITLHEVFGLEDGIERFDNGLFVVLESDGGRTALFVDDLLGQHQVVIKSLETNFRKVPGVSGATIMGDGRVALIIDVESLVRLSQEKVKKNAAA